MPSLQLKFLPPDFKLGLLVGPSGSGKTTLLRKFGEICEPAWDASQAVIEQRHFRQLSSEEAEDVLRQNSQNLVYNCIVGFLEETFYRTDI